MVFDLLGVRVDGPRADGQSIAIGWRFPDLSEEWTLRLEHGALNAWPVLDPDTDAVLTLSRDTLTSILVDPASAAASMEDGSLRIDGDAGALARLFGLLEQPQPGYNLIEP
jgi:alkyl sulfatase BDS1-like metallo-beta-lactamase superfamily hydrolase